MTLTKQNTLIAKLRRLGALVQCCIFAIVLQASVAHAQIPDSACDNEYMDSLRAHGSILVQKNIAQNKNIIAKPDSVLEYTCFREFMHELARAADTELFSGFTFYSDVFIFRPGQMAWGLTDLVESALFSYLIFQYSHTFVDDRLGFPPVIAPFVPIGFDRYDCNTMQVVWDAANCLNFANQPEDNFFNMEWYINDDPRRRVTPACNPNPNMADLINTAYNADRTPYLPTNEPIIDVPVNEPYLLDPIQTYTEVTLTPGAGPLAIGNCNAVTPVPTGVIVERTNFAPSSYRDHVCPSPSCYYVPGGGCQ